MKNRKKMPPNGELLDLAIDAETGRLEHVGTALELIEQGAGRTLTPEELLRFAGYAEQLADAFRAAARERSAA